MATVLVVPLWIIAFILILTQPLLGLLLGGFLGVVSVVVTVAAVSPEKLCGDDYRSHRILIGKGISFGISEEAFNRTADLEGINELRDALRREGLPFEVYAMLQSKVIKFELDK